MSTLVEVQTTPRESRQRVASLSELKQAGCLVVRGPDRPIALFFHHDRVYAIDNRCPHLGFPLHKGSIQDGILICHWHHARFDLASGCTFDLFADDVPAYPVAVEGDDVYLLPSSKPESAARMLRRLRTGMEQNVSLVVAKSVVALVKEKVSLRDILREAALFGARNRDSWGSGMVILGAMANVASDLPPDECALALTQGIAAAAGDAAGMAPRRDRHALDRDDLDQETARSWFRHWTLARHRDAADRTLRTVLEQAAAADDVADLIFSGITERIYADNGHTLDFANKAFEIADRIGWEHAVDLLPALTPGIVGSRGGEESSPWRYPIDLVALLKSSIDSLPEALQAGKGRSWSGEVQLSEAILGEDPSLIVDSLLQAVRDGAQPIQLGRALALAAATRIARFGTANEFGDWDTALHTFTYANAMEQVLKRCSSPEVLRGVFHGALSVYQDRFLNVPPAAVPLDDAELADLPSDGDLLLHELMETFNTQQGVGEAARLVSRYVGLNLPEQPLLTALVRATVQEDAAFHTFQMLEAGVRQYKEWKGAPQARLMLIAVARYLAAHSPTQRSFLQTFDIAQRLHRGDTLYEE